MSSPHVFVYPAFLHINSTLTYSVYVRLDWDLQTPFPMLFQPQLPGGVCMGDLRGKEGGKKGEDFLNFWCSHSWLWGSNNHGFIFCFVLYFNPPSIWYCSLLTGLNTAVQSPYCWFSLTNSVSLFPVLNTLYQKCTFLLSWLDLDRHSLQSRENKLI